MLGCRGAVGRGWVGAARSAFSRLKLHHRHAGERRGGGKTLRRISGCPRVPLERGRVRDSREPGTGPGAGIPGASGRRARSSSSAAGGAPRGCQLPVKPETRGLALRGRPGPSAGAHKASHIIYHPRTPPPRPPPRAVPGAAPGAPRQPPGDGGSPACAQVA